MEILPLEILEKIVRYLDNESKCNLLQVSKYFYKNKKLSLPMFPKLSREHELIHGVATCQKFLKQRPGFHTSQQSEQSVVLNNRKEIENCFQSPFGPLITLTYREGGAEMFTLSDDDFACHRPCLFTTEKRVSYVTYSPPVQDVFMGAFLKTEYGFYLVDVDRTEYMPCVYYLLVNIFGVMDVIFCLTNFSSGTEFFFPATYGFYKFNMTINTNKRLELEMRQLSFKPNRTKPMYVFFFCGQIGWVASDGIYVAFKRVFKFSTPVKFDDRGSSLAKAQRKVVNVLQDESHLFLHIDKWEKSDDESGEYNLEWIYIFDLMRNCYKFKIERENRRNIFYQTTRYYFSLMETKNQICRHDILDGERTYLNTKEKPTYILANNSHIFLISKTKIRCYHLHPKRMRWLTPERYIDLRLDNDFNDHATTMFIGP